ncbi:MAG: hypothetical protein JW762_08110 [Dehalococcoidales bacterium]|nr:hypothetical protein [Dehalococcoidales bacterium]
MVQVKIKVKGKLDENWSDWFDGFKITHASEYSILEGPVRDQAELRGILSRLADLGLELLSVNTLSEPKTKSSVMDILQEREK